MGRRTLVDVSDAVGREKILKIHLAGEALDPTLSLTETAMPTRDLTRSSFRDLVFKAMIRQRRIRVVSLQHIVILEQKPKREA